MRQEKLLTFIKISELYQAFMHTFFCQNALILSNHKFFAKKINIIWSGSINYLQARHFKDMVWDKMSRKIKKKIELYQDLLYWIVLIFWYKMSQN